MVVQGKKNDEVVTYTYSEVVLTAGEEEDEPLSGLNNLTSRINALLESVSNEGNELRPIEHKVIESSTLYFLMK